MAFPWIFSPIGLWIIALVLGINGRSSLTKYKQSSTPLIEASTAGIMTTVLTDTTNTNQETEITSWSLSMTSDHSLITTPQISTASDEVLATSSDNSIAHFTKTAISKEKDMSIQLITLLPSTQVGHSLLLTSKTESSNPVTASSVSTSLVQSLSSIELFSRAASLPTSRSNISAMTSTTTTSEMVILNSTHEVTTKTSIALQDSFTVGKNSNLLSHIEGSATTVVNHTGMTLATKTVAKAAWSSSSSSLSSTTTLSHASVVTNKSSLQTTSQSITGRSVSDSQVRQTGNIPIHKNSKIIFGSTLSLKSTSLISMISHSLKSLLSQSTSRGSNTSVLKQEDRSSSKMHVTIATTDGSGSRSDTQTATRNFTNGRSLRTTITHGSLIKTILPSFHTKGSKESLSVTPIVGQSSTFPLPSGGNGSFDVSALSSFTKGRESLETYPRTVAFSMSITTSTPKVQLNTSNNLSAATKTLNLVQTLNLSTRKSLPTSHGNTSISFALSITSLAHTINSSGVRSVIRPTTSSVASFSTIGSPLPTASFKPTISYSVIKTPLISKMYQATDVLSPVYVTVPSYNISFPNILNKTALLELTPNSFDKLLTTVFSEVYATRVSAAVFTSFQALTPKSILAEAKTSRRLLLFSNASGSVVTSIYQTENTISSSPILTMQSPSRMINDSASKGSVKDASDKLTITQHLSATTTSQFSSPTKDAMVLINTSNIRTIGSNLDSSLDTFAPKNISNIKSTPFQTVFGVSTYPFASSFTTKSLVYVKASNISTLLTASTAGSGSQFQSLTLVQGSSSTPIIVSPGVSETSVLVLTTQKPSKGASVNIHDKSSTHASIITVPSHSTDRNLSFAAELSSTSDSKQQRTSSTLVFATSSQSIKTTELPFGSVSTNTLLGNSIWTSFSTTKETLDSIQTKSSPSQETPPFTGRTTSSFGLDRTKTFGTAATTLVATVSLSTRTGPPPVSPKQFDVSMVLKMIWKSHYEYSYTPEFQALASKIKAHVTTVLMTLDGFLSLIVLRFWKGSVGVNLVVFVKKSAEVSEDTVERTLIEANNSGVLDLPLTNIQVQERRTTTTTTLATTPSTKEDKSIERWIIILIVSGILVFIMSLIICSLLVKLAKHRGGLRRRNKYQVSGANDYLSYLYTDRPEPGSKPVILRMEERRSDFKDNSSGASAYETVHSSSSREGSLSHKDSSVPPDDYTNSDYECITNDSATSSTVVLSTEKGIKELKEDSINVSPYTTASSESIQGLSHEDVETKISTDEKCVHQNHGFKDEDTF